VGAQQAVVLVTANGRFGFWVPPGTRVSIDTIDPDVH
jgi:hypothetical protein